MPALSLKALASLFLGVLLLGGLIILATGASVAYLGTLMFFAVSVIGTIALLAGSSS